MVAKSCLTLCDSTDGSPPGSSVHRFSQARILEGLPFPSPRDLPDSGIEPKSPALVDFPGCSDGKESACNAGDPGLILGSERSPGEGNGYPFQCSAYGQRSLVGLLIHGVVKSQIQLSD